MIEVNQVEHAPKYKSYIRVWAIKCDESDKAVCFHYACGGEIWYPKSQLIKVRGGFLDDFYYVKKWLLKTKE